MDTSRMTANEIRRNYNEAKDKPKQITILADMNQCSRADIKRILDGKTDELPDSTKKKSKGAVTEEAKQEIIRMHLNGCSGAEISRETGWSQPTVSKFISEYKDGKSPFNILAEQPDKNIPEEDADKQISPADEPIAGLDAPEIAGAIMECLLSDFADYIVEIKATPEAYTVRVKSSTEEITHTKRRNNGK